MLNLNTGDRITIIGVDSCMALTTKYEVEYQRPWVDDQDRIVVRSRGKRKEILLAIKHQLVFKGWDIPVKTDSELYGPGGSVMRGNACINLMGTPDDVRGYVEANNIKPQAKKSHIVAISGPGSDAAEVPVYPELYDGHAVIDRMLENLKS